MEMLASGTEVGRYRIESLLGSGGMGEVYRAYDTLLRRRVALKVLRSDLPDAAARLLREGRAAAALSHPNAVAIFDVGEAAGITFIAMELVVGKPMREFIGDKLVPMPERIRWLVDLARALSAAHQKGFVHRDIKPDNVMICADGSVKLLDFGIAKQAGPDVPPPSVAFSGPASYKTAEGRVTGTPRYMAPEQLRGDPLDARTDQYAWGVLGYELIAGVHPLSLGDGTRPPEMLNQRVPDLPFDVAAVVARAMAPAPELRFPSLDEAASVLARYVSAPAPLTVARPTPQTATVAATVDMSVPHGSTTLQARVHDAASPRAMRVMRPLLATGVFAVLAYMRVHRIGPFYDAAVVFGFVVAALLAWLRPLLELRRDPRLASVTGAFGVLRITRAGTWSQTIRPVGASLATVDQGVSVAVARPRTFDPPVHVEVASVDQARALLRAAGIDHAPFGVLRWSLGRGVFDAAAMAAALGWRILWLAVFLLVVLDFRILASLAIIVAVVMTVISTVLKALEPGPGPHLTLTERGVEVKGPVLRFASGQSTATDSLSLPLSSIVATRATAAGIEIDTANEKCVVRVVPATWSNRGLTKDEMAMVASHVFAAAAHARSGTFPAMLPGNAVQGGHGAESRTA